MAQKKLNTEVAGSVSKIHFEIGSDVAEGDEVAIVESMKMEIPVSAPCAGRIAEIRVKEGDVVIEGQLVAVIETA